MAPGTQASTRIAAVDGLRFLAALSVLNLHVWFASGRPDLDTPIGPFLTTLLAAGYVGVDFFFVLSGFVLFLPVCLNGGRFGSVPDYLLRRAARILPLYWVTLAVAAVGLDRLTTDPQAHDRLGLNLLLHLTFLSHPISSLSGLLEGLGANGVVWTLSLEVAFYLVLPLVAARFFRRPAFWFAFFVLLSALWRFGVTSALNPVSQAGPTIEGLALIAELPTYLPHFGLGMLAARIYVDFTQAASTDAGGGYERPALALTFFSGIGVIWGTHALGVENLQNAAGPYGQFTGTLPVTLAFACLLVGLLLGPAWLRRPFDNSLMRTGGEISYGIYLWHLLVIGLLATNLPLPTGGTRHFVLWLGLVLPTTLALAWVGHLVIERPVIEWARARTAPDAADVDTRGPELPAHYLDVRWVYALFVLYLVVLAFVLLYPNTMEHVFGLNLQDMQDSAEEVMNVLIFIPIGLVLAVFLRRGWIALALGFAAACVVELVQYAYLPDRTASFADVLKNTLGTGIGVLLAQLRPRK